jgi:NitT/TauT family transport system substrate-binding protein
MFLRLAGATLALLGLFLGPATAQTSLKFTLDFIMFGPNSPFVFAEEAGYFKNAGLSVRVDPSSGSGDAVNRLAF